MHIKTNPKDKISFNQLYNDYQTRFLNFANTYVRDWDVAEDITTEALIYYWENRNTLSEVSNIPAYILTIIKTKVLIIFVICRYGKNILKILENILSGNSMHVSFL